MSSEHSPQPKKGVLEEWVKSTDAHLRKTAISEIWWRGTFHPGHSTRNFFGEAGFILRNEGVRSLFSHIYPEAESSIELARLMQFDLQAMHDHDELLQEMDRQGRFVDYLERQLEPLLFGTNNPDAIRLNAMSSTGHLLTTPSLMRRAYVGMPSEMKVVAARIRLDYPGAHLKGDRPWPHDLLWWREQIVETLRLTPDEMLAVRNFGVAQEVDAS